MYVYLHSFFVARLRKHIDFETGCLRSSNDVDFGTNRKRVCDFLLVRHSNRGPSLRRFRGRPIAGFLLIN